MMSRPPKREDLSMELARIIDFAQFVEVLQDLYRAWRSNDAELGAECQKQLVELLEDLLNDYSNKPIGTQTRPAMFDREAMQYARGARCTSGIPLTNPTHLRRLIAELSGPALKFPESVFTELSQIAVELGSELDPNGDE